MGSNIISGATSSTYTPTPTSSTTTTVTYWVRRVGKTPCESTTTDGVTKDITVYAPPTGTLSISGTVGEQSTTTLCQGQSITLKANGLTSTGSGCKYLWGTGTPVGSNALGNAADVSGTNAVTITQTPTTTNHPGTVTYWVKVTGDAPCASHFLTATQSVRVNDKPTVPNVTAPSPICSGQTLTIPDPTVTDHG